MPAYSYGYGYSPYQAPAYIGLLERLLALPGSGVFELLEWLQHAYSNSAYVAGPGTLSLTARDISGYAPAAGYYGYARTANPYGYANRPYYGAYGYGLPSGNGFRPFRGMGRPFR